MEAKNAVHTLLTSNTFYAPEFEKKAYKYFEIGNQDTEALSKQIGNYLDQYKQECPICFDEFTKADFTSNTLIITKCGHVFHKAKSCFPSQPNHTFECSICRKVMKSSIKKDWEALQKTIHKLFKQQIEAMKDGNEEPKQESLSDTSSQNTHSLNREKSNLDESNPFILEQID